MTLQEIFDHLTSGELSQLSIGGGEAGVIAEANYPRVLSHINLGLTALYKRFNLKEGRIQLLLSPDRFDYLLTKTFAVSNTKSKQTDRYLLDTSAAPFQDDILKIERVLTDDGAELALNQPSDCYSVTTPTATALRVPAAITEMSSNLPDWLKTEKLELIYRANHPKLVLNIYGPDRMEVELPDSHLTALLLFVASRAHTPGGMTGEFNAGNNYTMKYEAECLALESAGLQIDRGDSSDCLFRQRGWV